MTATSQHTPHTQDRYPGTHPFTDNEADQRVFFGREPEIHESLHQILTTNLLVLFGKSGLGKTSLLHAGLFPRLREHDLLPLTVRLHDTEQPLLALIGATIADQCQRRAIDYTPGNPASLWEFFQNGLVSAWGTAPGAGPGLRSVRGTVYPAESCQTHDAGAELADFTSGRRPESFRARRRAGESVPYSDRPPEVKVVLSLRKDSPLGPCKKLTGELPPPFWNSAFG